MSQKARFQKKFTIKNFLEWDHQIFKNTMQFYEKYCIYPNILLANSETFQQIDAIANFIGRKFITDSPKSISFVISKNGKMPKLSGFDSEDFSLDFAVDENLKFGKITLVFEEDPEWGEDDWDLEFEPTQTSNNPASANPFFLKMQESQCPQA